MISLETLGKQAKDSARVLSQLLPDQKNRALYAIADSLENNMPRLIDANKKDIDAAVKNGMNSAMIDRLKLDAKRIQGIAQAVRYVAVLDDPVGLVLDGSRAANGLQITRITVPLGVVGIIFESRPNVTVDCAVLCLKSGNACILRGGSEAINSNVELVSVLHDALESVGLPAGCVQLVTDTSRDTAQEMMRLNDYIDVLIPRGGAGLIKSVVQNATVPVIETGLGNCHIFVDESAKLDMAADIVFNAKTSRPAVCNSLETLLVHKNCAEEFLPIIGEKLLGAGVELRGCDRTAEILGDKIVAATQQDYDTEYNDLILAIRVVEDTSEAIDHIALYSTHHSEAIITEDRNNSRMFTAQVDSAAVYVNASTRFTDGGEFGLGAEIGISTQKLHARGPMGLKNLTSYKYIVEGNGQVRV